MTPEGERPVESAWADRIRDDPQVASLYRFGQRQMEMAQIHGKRVKELEAECETLRAALAASQTREATCAAILRAIRAFVKDREWDAVRGEGWYYCTVCRGRKRDGHAEGCAVRLLLAGADPSPASDALGRVVRAAVAETLIEDEYSALDDSVRIHDNDLLGRWTAAKGVRLATVKALLAVAPHWGEPRGGG